MIAITTEYYRYTVSQLESKLGTSVVHGLCKSGVSTNQSKKRKYSVDIKHRKKYGLEVRRNLFASGFFAFIFIILSLLHCIFYKSLQYLPGCIICIICFLAVCGTYFYCKNLRSKCYRAAIPLVTVKRDGLIRRISCDKLLCGDLIYLSQGDVLTCDARLVYTDGFRVLEKNVNGGDGEKNSSFVCHEPMLDEKYQKNMVFAQSTVSSGHAIAIVCATGKDTLAARKKLPFAWKKEYIERKESNIRLFSKTRKLCTAFSSLEAVLILAFSFVVGILLFKATFSDAFMTLLCTCVLVECIYPIVYISTILHATKTDKNGRLYAYVKELSSLSAIKDITLLAVPKLSVLCTPSVSTIYFCGKEYNANELQSIHECKHLLCVAASTVDPSSLQGADDEALASILEKINLNKQIIDGFYVPVSYRQTDFIVYAIVQDSKGTMMCCRSTPSHLLKYCKYKNINGVISHLSEIELAELTLLYKKYEQDNLRVLAYATKRITNSDDSLNELCFEGFLALREQITENDAAVVSALASRGIKLIVFCDDISDSNFELGKSLGIVEGRQNVLTSYELNHSNLSILKLQMANYRMFLGLSTKEKQYVLEHLRCVKNEKIGIASSSFSDAVLISSKKYTSFDISTSTNCDAIKLLSDIEIIPNEEKSVLSCISSIIVHSSHLSDGLRKIKRHFTLSVWLTVFAVLFSLFTPFFSISATAVLLCYSLLDLAAAFCFISGKANRPGIKSIKSQQVFATGIFIVLTPSLLYASGVGTGICTCVVISSLILCHLFSFLYCTLSHNTDKSFIFVYCAICVFLLLLYSPPLIYFIYSIISPCILILSELIIKIAEQNKH